ncbi:hypothetical protein [Streptomyces sp. NPDC054784]
MNEIAYLSMLASVTAVGWAAGWALPDLWQLIAGPPPKPIKAAPKADPWRIGALERELGIGGHPPEQSIRGDDRVVCLTKDCDGETLEPRTWTGELMYRVHNCRKPGE